MKQYEKLEVTFVMLQACDVITTSVFNAGTDVEYDVKDWLQGGEEE